MLSANPGDEVVVADSALADEDLIPVDGVDREPISGGVVVAGVKEKTSKFNRQMMADREQLLRCDLGPFVVWVRRKMENVRSDMVAAAPTGGGSKSGNNGDTSHAPTTSPIRKAMQLPNGINLKQVSSGQPALFTPIAYSAGNNIVPVSLSSSMNTLTTTTALIKHTGQAQVVLEKQAGTIDINNGQTFVYSYKPTVVNSMDAKIIINPETMALISREGNIVKIRNIYELNAKSISIVVGGKFFHIAAGEEVCLGQNGTAIVKSLMDDAVGRRRLQNIDVSSGHSLTRCEVSLVSLVQHSEVLTRIKDSTNPADKALAQKLVKMAACLSFVTAGHGPFGQLNP
jgi:hypothetical protein